VVRTDRGIDPVGLGFAVAPGIAGFLGQMIQGPPDTSGIDAAASFADRSTGMMVPPHTFGSSLPIKLIDENHIDNEDIAAQLGENRFISNMNPTPGRTAAILANDMNHIIQRGKNRIAIQQYNDKQRKDKTMFDSDIAEKDATILNQTDQFNAQMLANARDKSA